MDDFFWSTSAPPSQEKKMQDFLESHTPASIEQSLNKQVIGQSELTKAVADFLYYHALRQLHPELPQRPLLVSGPSGSGKTEVWRVAAKLYSYYFTIQVIDGSSMSCDGWSGSYKIGTFVTKHLANGGILVVDEFDKLTKPKYNSSFSNVSLEMQAEFLKLLEGEYQIMEGKKPTGLTSKKMGFVLVGAFESLREKKEAVRMPQVKRIGFYPPEETAPKPVCSNLTDNDFIAYGIMPELVGRIAEKCSTKELTTEVYMEIIKGPHSRVALISRILTQHGADLSQIISDDALREMIALSRSNKTGVRWVSAQVERRLLERIRQDGLSCKNTAPAFSSETLEFLTS